jgi:hypothetical protein
MKKYLLALFLFISSHPILYAQTLYTLYASCGTANGYFVVEPPSLDCTFLWSTGETICCVSVPPGNYWVTVTDTVNGTSSTIYPTMWADTWQLHIAPTFPGSVLLLADLLGCQSLIYTAPSCNPIPSDDAYGIIWEDSIPIDTIINVSCDNWSHPWTGTQPGHCYDFSIYDPSCNCFQATWMYNPSRRYCEALTNVKEVGLNKRIKLIPSIINSEARFEADNWKIEENIVLKIYNTMDLLMREDKITNLTSYILHRDGLSDGLYFYELQALNSELLGTGKFVIQ